MIKFLGAGIIIGLSTLAGYFFSQKYSERCQLLKIWLQILDIFQTEMFYNAHMLPEVFQKTASALDDRYFVNAFTWLASSLEFGTNEDFGEAWGRFLIETGLGVLTKHDYQVLNELGNYLGSADRHDLLDKLKGCRVSIESNLRAAEVERSKRTVIYRYLGFAMGAIVVLWLI